MGGRDRGPWAWCSVARPCSAGFAWRTSATAILAKECNFRLEHIDYHNTVQHKNAILTKKNCSASKTEWICIPEIVVLKKNRVFQKKKISNDLRGGKKFRVFLQNLWYSYETESAHVYDFTKWIVGSRFQRDKQLFLGFFCKISWICNNIVFLQNVIWRNFHDFLTFLLTNDKLLHSKIIRQTKQSNFCKPMSEFLVFLQIQFWFKIRLRKSWWKFCRLFWNDPIKFLSIIAF